MLWSDPSITDPSWTASTRGAGIIFGEDVVRQFVTHNNLSIVVRSHQLVNEGFEYLFDNTFLTIFSCSNYTGKNNNKGAIAIFRHGSDYQSPEIKQYTAYVVGNLRDTQADCVRETMGQIYERI